MGFAIFESSRLISVTVGLFLVFLAERYFSTSSYHAWLYAVGVTFLLWGMVVAVAGFFRAKRQGFLREMPGWLLTIIWQCQIGLSLIFYFLYRRAIGERNQPETIVEKIFLVGFLVLGVIGFFMALGVEWAQFKNSRGQYAEPQRIRLATANFLHVGILVVIIASLNYVAIKKNVGWDLSYLKTSRPSTSTSQMIGQLDRDVRVALFFPQGNEVLARVRLYFDAIAAKDSRLTVEVFDMEISPVEAEQYKVSRNGFVVLRSADMTSRIDFGLTLESARKMLKSLDSEFQRSLVEVTQEKKVLYFTRGHGELGWVSDEKESGDLRSIKKLESYLRNSGYTVRFLGLSDGAANSVPGDADAVVIIGGSQSFLADEARVIKSYVEAGGKLLAMFDLDVTTEASLSPGVRDVARDPLIRWFRDLGVEFNAQVLGNEINHVRATGSPVDRWFLVSNVFTSHASVQTLARNEQRAAMIFLKSGYFINRGQNSDWVAFDTVRSLSDTFVDKNRDFRFDEKLEKREPVVLGVALEQKSPVDVSKKSGKIVALADASVVSDSLIENQANLIYFVDSLRWLFGESSVLGVPSSEEDVPIRHSKNEDIAWFYGTVMLVPALVLIAGRFATTRARRRRSSRHTEGGR